LKEVPPHPLKNLQKIFSKDIAKYIFFKFFEVQKLFFKKVSGGVQGQHPCVPASPINPNLNATESL